MFLLKSKVEKMITDLNSKLSNSNDMIDKLKKEYALELEKIKSENEEKINKLEEENNKLKSHNTILEMRYTFLECKYEEYASWIKNTKCKLISDTFGINKNPLPTLDSEQVQELAKSYSKVEV